MDAYLVSNSPGEVSTWVRPVARALRTLAPCRIHLVLVPCPYATGMEATVAAAFPEIDRVYTPWESLLGLLGLRRFEGGEGPRVVAYLGGELWHARWLARRLECPAVAYLERPFRRVAGFTAVAAANPAAASTSGARLVGDLMVDAVQQSLPGRPTEPALALFPGSRYVHMKTALTPFLNVAERTASDKKVMLALSPFIKNEQLQRACEGSWLKVPQARARVEGDRLLTEGGLEVELIRGRPYEAIDRCAVALSIPGTNTAQLACAGKPFVLVVHRMAQIGGGGLFGLVDRLPLGPINPWLRRRKMKKRRLLALPNILAGEMVAPERDADDRLDNLVEAVGPLLDEPERAQRLGARLKEVMGQDGAGLRVAQMLLDNARV